MTKALTRDVHNFMYFISLYVNNQKKCNLNPHQELSYMLQEISIVNEGLFVLYFGKYIYAKICNIVEPNWINTNSKDFDKFFKCKSLDNTVI